MGGERDVPAGVPGTAPVTRGRPAEPRRAGDTSRSPTRAPNGAHVSTAAHDRGGDRTAGRDPLAGIAALLPASLPRARRGRCPTRRPRRRRRTGDTGGSGGHHRPADRRRAQALAPLGPELWLAWTLPGGFGKLGPTEEVLGHWVDGDVHVISSPRRSRRFASERLGSAGRIGERAVRARDRGRRGGLPRVAQALAARVSSLWAREPDARPSFAGLRRAFETERILDQPGLPERAVKLALATALGGHPPPAADAPSSVEAVKSATVAEFAYKQLTRERAHATFFAPTPPSSGGEDPARRDGRGARGGGVRGNRDHPGRGGLDFEPARRAAAAATGDRDREAGDRVDRGDRSPPGCRGRRLARFPRRIFGRRSAVARRAGVARAAGSLAGGGLHILPARGATRDLSVRHGRVPARAAARGADRALRQGDRDGHRLAGARRAAAAAGECGVGRGSGREESRAGVLARAVRRPSLCARRRHRRAGLGRALRRRCLVGTGPQPARGGAGRRRRRRPGRGATRSDGAVAAVQDTGMGGGIADAAGGAGARGRQRARAAGAHAARGRPGRHPSRLFVANDDRRRSRPLRVAGAGRRDAPQHGAAHR